jgi:hypothetical protein
VSLNYRGTDALFLAVGEGHVSAANVVQAIVDGLVDDDDGNDLGLPAHPARSRARSASAGAVMGTRSRSRATPGCWSGSLAAARRSQGM